MMTCYDDRYCKLDTMLLLEGIPVGQKLSTSWREPFIAQVYINMCTTMWMAVIYANAPKLHAIADIAYYNQS